MIESGAQFKFPATTWAFALTSGEAASTVGHSAANGVGVGGQERGEGA